MLSQQNAGNEVTVLDGDVLVGPIVYLYWGIYYGWVRVRCVLGAGYVWVMCEFGATNNAIIFYATTVMISVSSCVRRAVGPTAAAKGKACSHVAWLMQPRGLSWLMPPRGLANAAARHGLAEAASGKPG
jgi:hypothetical protein